MRIPRLAAGSESGYAEHLTVDLTATAIKRATDHQSPYTRPPRRATQEAR